MTKTRFIEERGETWERFAKLLEKVDRSRLSKLSGGEVSQFSQLFRAVCYDLATVRSRDWGRELEDHLNSLVLRGHSRFYRAPPGRPGAVVRFFTRGFPRLLRANAAYFWVAVALFVVPGLISGVVVYQEPSLTGRILPASMQELMDTMYSEETKGSDDPEETRASDAAAGMFGFYIRNNVGIAFKCFALGVFAGIGTILVLIFNSIYLGTVTGFLLERGHSERFLSFVISHGAFELTAIVVSGAAGLILGHSIVHPGVWSRLESLRRRGLDAVRLAAGAGAMLAVAALIEAFWSPSAAPSAAKYAVGSLLWVVVIAYLVLAGRDGGGGEAGGRGVT